MTPVESSTQSRASRYGKAPNLTKDHEMLFDLTVKIKAPGQSPEDALARLKAKIPHWEIEIGDSRPSENQPPSIIGTASITLPPVVAAAN